MSRVFGPFPVRVLLYGLVAGLALRAASPHLPELRRSVATHVHGAFTAMTAATVTTRDDTPSNVTLPRHTRRRSAERLEGVDLARVHARVLELRHVVESMVRVSRPDADGGSPEEPTYPVEVNDTWFAPEIGDGGGAARLALLSTDVDALIGRVRGAPWRNAVRPPCPSPPAPRLVLPTPLPCPTVPLPDPLAIGPLSPQALLPARRRVFITYGDAAYERNRARLAGEATALGVFDEVIALQPSDIDPAFAARHAAVLAERKGGGTWLWKPHILLRQLSAMSDGDVLFYADAGCTFVGDPAPYFALAERWGLLTFRLSIGPMRKYIKGIAFERAGMPISMWGREPMLAAGILVLQRRPTTLALVAEWLRYAEDPLLLTDVDTSGIVPNAPDFVAHRHDQSLWSLVVYRHAAPLVIQQQHWPKDRAVVIAATRSVG